MNKFNIDHDSLTLVQENFLSADDITDIKEKVLLLKDLWQPHSRTDDIFLLPYGAYNGATTENISQYKPVMKEKFGTYYEKILDTLTSIFGLSKYDDQNNYPGFHIFPGPLESTGINFHNDAFPQFPNNFYETYSAIIPIELGSNCGLLYTDKKYQDKFNHFRFDSTFTDCIHYPYTIGNFYIWYGKLVHSIAPVTLQENQHRITMQMHIAIPKVNFLKRPNTVFW